MKSPSTVAHPRMIRRGFTLLELLVVIVIIGILAALTLGAFRYAQESAARNRTVSAHAAIRAALELYKEKFAEYPEPANPDEQDRFAGVTMRTGGAEMLYQAITGDGNSAIKFESTPDNGTSQSDGEVTADEKDNVISSSTLPKSVIYPTNAKAGVSGPRLLVDGWNRPFQYDKANTDPTKKETVNSTYDLWSFGPPVTGRIPQAVSPELKRDPVATGAWVKNW